jgi:hypothetical protein
MIFENFNEQAYRKEGCGLKKGDTPLRAQQSKQVPQV